MTIHELERRFDEELTLDGNDGYEPSWKSGVSPENVKSFLRQSLKDYRDAMLAGVRPSSVPNERCDRAASMKVPLCSKDCSSCGQHTASVNFTRAKVIQADKEFWGE